MKLEYVNIIDSLLEKPSMELLSEKLFQLGHEHEIEGSIFNMELTPNRGDCLSVNGLARDLNIFFGKTGQAIILVKKCDIFSLKPINTLFFFKTNFTLSLALCR